MLTSFDTIFWLNFLYFILAAFVAFFIPGDVFLQKLELTGLKRIVLASVLGLVLWAWQGMIFGYLGLRELSYIYLLIFIFVWIKIFLRSKFDLKFFKNLKIDRSNWIIALLIVTGTVIQLNIVWYTGILFPDGFIFCCANESDLLFHASLTNQIINHFPPFQPGLYGEIVHNYHSWSNIVLAELIRVFKLPIFATQFQYAMVFVSLFLGLTVVVFGQILKASKTFMAWLLFFLYFGGDLVYLLLHFYGTGINFSVSSLENGAGFLANPPRAFSIIIFFAGLSLLAIWIKRKDLFSGMLMALVLGSVIGFKVYTGIFVLIGLAFLGLYYLFTRKFKMAVTLLIVPIISFIIYAPVNKEAGGLFFTGLWRFENFRTIPHWRLERQEYAKWIYYQHNNWPRIIQYEAGFALLYIVSTFGSKLLGLIQTKRSFSILPAQIHLFLIPALIISTVVGLFFMQSSGGANTFNFLVSAFIIGSIYTASIATYLTEKFNNKIIAALIIFIIVIFTIPRNIYEVVQANKRLIKHESFVMKNNELEVYEYLRKDSNKNSQILVVDIEFGVANKSPYISLFADKNVFLSGREILISHGIDIQNRKKIEEEIINSSNPTRVSTLLKENNIDYLLLSKIKVLPVEATSGFMNTVFSNDKYKILKPTFTDIQSSHKIL